MASSSLKFGTSGLRGLAEQLNGLPAYAWSRAFLEVLETNEEIKTGDPIFIGRDLRPSSPDIAALCYAAIADSGLKPIDCGIIPTPALAAFGILHSAPAIMVTGSHIPDDRNGLKFYRADGEINKRDEAAIIASHADLYHRLSTPKTITLSAPDLTASIAFKERYLNFLPPKALAGLCIGVYQHSSVARDIILEVLAALGAKAVGLGRSDSFIPVDTEALREEDITLLKQWSTEHGFDAIVSTDGDADRPLIADEHGRFVRGDLVGAITASWLGADTIVVPVTANSALETCGQFPNVLRTKVGSPYVIGGMKDIHREGARAVIGFEANGGVLLGTGFEQDGRHLSALPTRDSLLPILACLCEITSKNKPLSNIAMGFDFRIALADRLQNVPSERSGPFIERLLRDDRTLRAAFTEIGEVSDVDSIDGVRIHLGTGGVVHYRASGNAPELRCYVEAETETHARDLLTWSMNLAKHETGKTERV
ncbi:phosphomannomutase [Nitratireductor aquibiodomus RA22]|uniref:Phosphomannomutase n=1 Tax=Nitratireductor aquibiodomus RA22 TaxID=1189611 RepID=I5BQ05_9HYPH|nr:phosphomannomutase [Nitratireductor aquibiodomus]EIM71657.1 phosphomannomutase [Nitratireductor aquibiodomus RA22]